MKKKEYIRDKFREEKRPGVDFGFFEVHVSPSELEALLQEHTKYYNPEISESTYLINRKYREHMLVDIYKAAAECLTDRQFQIFTLRYKFCLLETDIARQIGVIQPYISNTLKVCHKKIRQFLKLEKKKRRRRKSFKNHTKINS